MKETLGRHIHPKDLHHAYCISGTGISASFSATFFAFLESELAVPTRGNPDFWHGQFESLSIDDTRAIKEMQQRSAAVTGAKKVFVISTDTITHEAQNALLKVFEEPTADTHFFLLMPSVEVLLPTLRSRLVIVPLAASEEGEGGAGKEIEVKAFLGMSKGKRMALIKPLVEGKDKKAALALVDGLIRALSPDSEKIKAYQADLEELLTMRGYLSDRSSSVKMILEHLTNTLK